MTRASSRDRFREIDGIFDAALDLAPDEREAFLARACGNDATLRKEVDTLLDAHDRSATFLESPAVQIGAAMLSDELPSSTYQLERAGPFRIVRELGHGGMGVVYLAEREGAEFEQHVALKLIRHAGRSDALTRRFIEERRILAKLEHPGIARFIDGGLTERGMPYLAMELAEGEPIDVYCDARQLTIDQRIVVFVAVCDAVQYAHEHLIIHRDLKPSNIVVTAAGQLKLLDFGIAKLLDPMREDGDGATQTGLVALTPDYAAPEQLRGQPVSTATDTYALCVLLYTLLAGRRPYEVCGRTPAEVERIVCEVEPVRPSATLDGRTADDAERARARGTTADRLRRQLRGDLDLIVTKALHKEPARRYSSAAALRDDLQRFRSGLPIRARPDSAGYRLRKFAHRHRAALGAAIITLVALVTAIAFSAVQMREAERQRDAAMREIRRQRATMEVQAVLAGDSRDAEGRPLSVQQRIAIAERLLSRQFSSEPWLVAEVMVGLSGRLYDLGDRNAQRQMLMRARDIARAANAPTQLALADCVRVSSLAYDRRLDSARVALAEAQAALARPGGRTDLATAMCLDAEGRLLDGEGKPDSAVAVLRRAVALAQRGDASAIRLQTMTALGTALRGTGRSREAAAVFHAAVAGLDSAGYQGTDVLPNVVSFLTASLNELGELAAVDSVLRAAIESQAVVTGQHASGLLNFLYGYDKLRLGLLDSADVWITRAMRDTTEGAGGLSAYFPPAITQLRLEQGRLAEARAHFATLPTGTLIRRVNRSWLGARISYAEGDVREALRMLEDSLRAIAGSVERLPAALAMPFVTAAEWRLAAGEPQRADSLAALARLAGAVDTLALERNAYVGRAELVRARARLALGDARAARTAAGRAIPALANGYGPASRWTREARAFRDSLPR